VNNRYDPRIVSTVGVDFGVKTILLGCGKAVKLNLWDIAGQERFRAIASSYYRGNHCVLLVYDVSCLESLRNCENLWANEVMRLTVTPNPVILLLGNKADLNDDATREKAAQICAQRGWTHLTTSAKNGSNVENAFRSVAERVIVHWSNTRQLPKSTNTLPILGTPTRVKEGCCAMM
jgi:small GTP-binding protein